MRQPAGRLALGYPKERPARRIQGAMRGHSNNTVAAIRPMTIHRASSAVKTRARVMDLPLTAAQRAREPMARHMASVSVA